VEECLQTVLRPSRTIRGIAIAAARNMSQQPSRLVTFSYVGLYRYALTFCTHRRKHVFTVSSVVERSLMQISRAAADHQFSVFAYCFMPDHLHLVVEAGSDCSSLTAFSHALKQRTGAEYQRGCDETLWQKGHYEHVIRNDEATIEIAKYVFANPVRAGLVREPADYPFSGSLVLERRQLEELWQCGTHARHDRSGHRRGVEAVIREHLGVGAACGNVRKAD
jgi:putative transposase